MLENQKIADNEITEEMIDKIKKKRGRKSKQELLMLKKYNDLKKKREAASQKVQKKRGRKPKGGAIVSPVEEEIKEEIKEPNIILHLKCSSRDIQKETNMLSSLAYDPNIQQPQPYNQIDFDQGMPKYYNIEVSNNGGKNFTGTTEGTYEGNLASSSSQVYGIDGTISSDIHGNSQNKDCETKCNDDAGGESSSMKVIWGKLKELQYRMNKNSISDKKCACFWCTCDFDTPPIRIPKFMFDEKYEVYGCFCSPECAVAHLFQEKIDSSTKWERYTLLNNIYSEIYHYDDNIKPAPSPHYLLKKFYGNLDISEYRQLIRKKKQILVVNKPLTHVLPELVEDDCDFKISNKFKQKEGKKEYKLARNKPSYNKLVTNSKSWMF